MPNAPALTNEQIELLRSLTPHGESIRAGGVLSADVLLEVGRLPADLYDAFAKYRRRSWVADILLSTIDSLSDAHQEEGGLAARYDEAVELIRCLVMDTVDGSTGCDKYPGECSCAINRAWSWLGMHHPAGADIGADRTPTDHREPEGDEVKLWVCPVCGDKMLAHGHNDSVCCGDKYSSNEHPEVKGEIVTYVPASREAEGDGCVRLTGKIVWDIDAEEASGIDGVSVRGLVGFVVEAIQEHGGIEISQQSMGIWETENVEILIRPMTSKEGNDE